MIVELVQMLTRADGAALALRDGDQMLCRATIGCAPDLGVTLRADSGLSGECMRTGLTVRSDDTSKDPRVDAEACRILNVGSIAVTPIFRDDATDGILEILGHKPNAFTHIDIALLPQMSELVARLSLAMQVRTRERLRLWNVCDRSRMAQRPPPTPPQAQAPRSSCRPPATKDAATFPLPTSPDKGRSASLPGTAGNA